MLKGAIFDFDGTLFDSMFVWETAGEAYLTSLGIQPKENLQNSLKSMSLVQSAIYIAEKYSLKLDVQEIMDGINKTVENFYFYTVEPKQGVIEFLESLKSMNVKMCIATATDRYQVEAALKRCDMDTFFSEIFTCTEVGFGKDGPIIFQKAMEHLNTSKEDTVIFEDAYYAVNTAKSNGFLTVAVYDSSERRQSEIRTLTDCYLEDFTQVDTFLKFLDNI
ncbi:MAG: HAD family phosphatase [Ruminococcus sp.]|nr:HAD family phosphatase [Ruminococcus sp.]